jgi:hypothetical protein
MRLTFTSPLLLGLILACAQPSTVVAQASRINQSAQELAKHLGPTPPAGAHRAEDLAALSKRMIIAIERMEASYRSNGPRPESLIEKAVEFRQDMGDWERLMVANAVLSAWRDANGMGLFNKFGTFSDTVTKGRGVDDRCTFELIVPGERYPEGSNQLANVRLVRIEERRKKDAPETPAEMAFRGQLAKMIDEKKGRASLARIDTGPKTNAVGQTEDQALALWEKDMETAGDLAQALPNIRLKGDVKASPSHMTQQRWRVGCEVTNLSKHPTEVTVEIWLIGVTDKKRDHYVMSRETQKVKLRSNESRIFDFFTKAESSYKGKADDHDELTKAERAKSKVRFRGYVIQVSHEKGLAAFGGNDQMLTGYGDPEAEDSPLKRLPAF